MTPQYLRFVRAIAFVGTTTAFAACAPVVSTGGSCNRQGESCTVGEAEPANGACCRCFQLPDSGAGADGGDATGAPGTWGNYCIGPLAPPTLAA